MGAEQFVIRVAALTADAAFRKAREHALYEYGHRGYTGTIAEKSSFDLVVPLPGEAPLACVDRCLDDENHFCQNKWGPAACVDMGENLAPNRKERLDTFTDEDLIDPNRPVDYIFCFFGWASC